MWVQGRHGERAFQEEGYGWKRSKGVQSWPESMGWDSGGHLGWKRTPVALIDYADGRHVVIGSQRPEELAEAIRALLKDKGEK